MLTTIPDLIKLMFWNCNLQIVTLLLINSTEPLGLVNILAP